MHFLSLSRYCDLLAGAAFKLRRPSARIHSHGGFGAAQSRRRLQLEGLESRRLLSGGPFGGEILLPTTETFLSQGSADVAMNSTGEFVAVWRHTDSSGDHDIFARAYHGDGRSKTSIDIPVATSSADQHQPRISMSSSGAFVVVWEQYGVPDRIYYRRYSADGDPLDANPVAVDTSEINTQANPDVAMYDNGDFVVVWQYSYSATDRDIHVRAFSANGVPKFATKNVVSSSSNETDPRVAVDAGAVLGFAVTWEKVVGASGDVHVKSFDMSGTGVSSDINASSSLSGDAADPAIDMNVVGHFAISWSQGGTGFRNTHAQPFTFGGAAIVPPLNVETQSSVDSRRSAVGIANDDKVVVVYESINSRAGDVFYTVYDGSVKTDDVRTEINSGDTQFQGSPSIAMNGAGRFAIVYDQLAFSGILDVYARLFRENSAPVAIDDAYVLSRSAASILAAGQGPATNDNDPDGDRIYLDLVSEPTRGRLDINLNGTYTYTRGPSFVYFDRLTYRVSDAKDEGNVATVTLLTYEASQVYKLYIQVLGRPPEDGGLEFWAAKIANGGKYSEVAQGIFESNERLDPIVSQYYRTYLLREPDSAGLSFWRDKVWKRDGGPENVIAGMISSPEFVASAGGTNRGWITALYNRLLGRSPDPEGLNFWVSNLDDDRLTKLQVVLGFVHSDENFGNLGAGWYSQYLKRLPSADEIRTVIAQMRGGASHRQVQLALIDTDEYRNTPASPAPGTVNRLPFNVNG